MRLWSVTFFLTLITTLAPSLFAETPPADYDRMLRDDWLRQAELRYTSATGGVSPEDDALGAVDGVISGQWGFHTALQANPYWQVDLGEICTIGAVRIYNRCDVMGERNRFLIAKISDDGEHWEQVWKNDGTMFYGKSDSKPLVVDFGGTPIRARFLRFTLEGTQYLHLDEVEMFAPGSNVNIAIGKKATQSSTSQWSVRHFYPASLSAGHFPEKVFQSVLKSGQALADHLKQQGVDVSGAKNVFEELANAPVDEANYFRLRSTIRKLALSNPVIDFDAVLFVKNAPGTFPHMSDQCYCYWQRGGGAVCLLKNIKSDSPEVVELTKDWPNGTFFRPELSYDGKNVLFAYSKFDPNLSRLPDKTDKSKIAEESYFHLFEMEIATGKTRQLTFGKYDDFDGRYLPDGKIVFLSTRKGTPLQTGTLDVERMKKEAFPDSFVRCGGDCFRPVSVYTLHEIDPDGTHLRQISAFENFEWTPAVMNDGRIAYTRWDYIDRFNGPFFSLWSTYPDGTKTSLLYGNYTARPQVVIEPAAVPGSTELVFVASAHHSNFGGSLVLLDQSRGTEGEEPIERLTPEVMFPETEGWPDHYYANPRPLSRDYYLVSWSDKKLPPHTLAITEADNPSNSMGIYYFDRFGNLELLYRDKKISVMNPIPLRSRPVPPMISQEVDWDGPQEGEFLVHNVYKGLESYGFTPETHPVRSLRIIATVPKVQPTMNSPVLGVSAEDPGKFVLGTVPVEEDGSAYFRVPAGIPYLFQALDEHGAAVQTMRSLAYVMPGEKATCVGCHEYRNSPSSSATHPKAAMREPSKIKPDPQGSWPLKFSELVQPVLNDRCVSCHSPESREKFAAKLDLTAGHAYQSLLAFGNNDLRTLAFERDRSVPGETVTANSRLWKLLNDPAMLEAHRELKLSRDDLYRFAVWMDTYAYAVGSFSTKQEDELKELQKKYANLLELIAK
ncbi:MAG: discoidin domain-containing protein [Planctomycetaceae bacterium]|nr:discoidin domain-containing protein [Planctomycetaceae bacterium]